MSDTKRIDLFIRPNSTVSKDGAIDYAYDRANDRDNDSDEDLAHYYDVTDARDGSKYMVFGDKAQDTLKLGKVLDLLDKKEFVKGFTNEIIISSDDGTATIELPYSMANYNVVLTVKDDLIAIARVENETNTDFTIVLYDGTTYAEDKIKLNCSEHNITVNYVVVSQ